MKRFTNATIIPYHFKTINEFSDIHHLIATGVTKGHSINKYSWVADLLFKHAANLAINPHIGYLAFISDNDIMRQEYGNVTRLHVSYPFLSRYGNAILPNDYYELSSKQYLKIGQKFAEWDVIEYLNVSDFDSNVTGAELEFSVNHGYYRSPSFYNQGYKYDMDYDSPSVYKYYDKYVWAQPNLIKAPGLVSTYILRELGFELEMSDFMADLIGQGFVVVDDALTNGAEIKRIMDYKIMVDNPKFHYVDSPANEWVLQLDISAGTNKYIPYIGFVQCFDNEWVFLDPFNVLASQSSIKFYPEIAQNGLLEPAKAIVNWGVQFLKQVTKIGTAVFNSGIHLDKADDQSRIVFNICRHMTTWDGELDFHEIKKRDPDTTLVLEGVDIDTERNRRHAAVVMTEPYFTTKPIANGQTVKMSFINWQGKPIQYEIIDDFIDNPAMYLKIKAPIAIIRELDSYLKTEEYNTDIINTLIIREPKSEYTHFNNSAEFYENFGSSTQQVLFRQEFCLDDLVGGIVGTGHHKEFWISPIGPQDAQYNNDRMKVSGIGYGTKTRVSSEGMPISAFDEYMYIYCTNYTPISAPPPDDITETPIPNDAIELIDDTDIVSKVVQYERFRPMVKWPGINGYIKILERNPHFKVTRAPDGEYEVIYNVEFPYCPGSFNERVSMNFSDTHPFLANQILYKADYINAGSWACDTAETEKRYDNTNLRYSPYANDGFNLHQLFKMVDTADDYNIVDNYVLRYMDYIITTEHSKSYNEVIRYPSHLVWNVLQPELISLVKPQYDDYRKYGTYQAALAEQKFYGETRLPYVSTDLKLISLADNRQWNFDKNRFISYIGRENPALVCEMDVSTLFKDFTSYQKLHGSVPDVKRWLYGYFTGFAHTIASASNGTRSELTGPSATPVISTQNAKSDITIEIWDSQSDIGNDQTGNWRPLSVLSSDSEKVSGDLIVDNLYILDDPGTGLDNPVQEFGDVWSMIISYADFTLNLFKFPAGIVGLFLYQSNLVLANLNENKNYHIIYIEPYTHPTVPEIETYKMYIRYDSGVGNLFIPDITVLDPDNTPPDGWTGGVLSIHKPKKLLSKASHFNFSTNVPSPTVVTEFITRYIDIKTEEGTNDIPDMARYVNSDNKVFFRIRVRKFNDYPSNYINEDTSDIQYLGIVTDEWDNFPWGNDITKDAGFSWAKIAIAERIKKFGLTYFKCASK